VPRRGAPAVFNTLYVSLRRTGTGSMSL
jgi:hypothetical protein